MRHALSAILLLSCVGSILAVPFLPPFLGGCFFVAALGGMLWQVLALPPWTRRQVGPAFIALQVLALAAICIGMGSSLAMAQDAAAAVALTTIDPSAIVNIALSLVGPTVMVCLTWLANRAIGLVADHLGLKMDAQTRSLIESAIAKGIAMARHSLDGKLSGLHPIDVRNAQVALAVDYILPKIPDALAYFSITPQGLAQRVAAALGQELPVPAGDPSATAPPTVPVIAPAPAVPSSLNLAPVTIQQAN